MKTIIRKGFDSMNKRTWKHGMSNTRLYKVWAGMKTRCNNPNKANYGAKGIKVCDEWVNDFEAFSHWSIANGYEDYYTPNKADTLTIDRIDSDGDYEPSNCQWITFSENSKKIDYSNRANVVLYECRGKTLSIPQWAEELGVKEVTIRKRLDRGWSIEEALEIAFRGRRKLKLTREDVKEIRTSYVPYSKTHGAKQLADKYGITAKTVRKIIRRELWKDVD